MPATGPRLQASATETLDLESRGPPAELPESQPAACRWGTRKGRDGGTVACRSRRRNYLVLFDPIEEPHRILLQLGEAENLVDRGVAHSIGVLDRLALLVLVVCRRGRVVLEGQECVAHSRVGQEPGKELGVALGELYGEARRDTARRPAARRRVSATCGGSDTGRCRAATEDAEVREHSLADGSGRTLLLSCVGVE